METIIIIVCIILACIVLKFVVSTLFSLRFLVLATIIFLLWYFNLLQDFLQIFQTLFERIKAFVNEKGWFS
ncbi:hypothetical protein GCM10007425_06500 [Lysinibacillus alkalisoli]|uniref:Uncharacterized protein n=1 Tax=Lysinibacillus alkalisoli TaxID=1911548 RepID=A0A917FZ59_9BACI|nr:hypothetical protein [Lysinibacillus alkalisoli]GGG14914.1 hypothetical protein GCM10007425_06500 [Lysinibacillus alkalisoli]